MVDGELLAEAECYSSLLLTLGRKGLLEILTSSASLTFDFSLTIAASVLKIFRGSSVIFEASWLFTFMSPNVMLLMIVLSFFD
jgi:hypothetical protein